MPEAQNPLDTQNPLNTPQKCNAKSKRSGKQCQHFAMHGRAKCYNHGGVSNSGPLKHGRNSKLRHIFGEKFDSANDDELLKFEDDIRLFLARESELLDRVNDGNPDEGTWARILDLSERRTRLVERAIASMTKIEDAITTRYMIVIMGQILDIIRQEATPDVCTKIKRRFEIEVIGSVPTSQSKK